MFVQLEKKRSFFFYQLSLKDNKELLVFLKINKTKHVTSTKKNAKHTPNFSSYSSLYYIYQFIDLFLFLISTIHSINVVHRYHGYSVQYKQPFNIVFSSQGSCINSRVDHCSCDSVCLRFTVYQQTAIQKKNSFLPASNSNLSS